MKTQIKVFSIGLICLLLVFGCVVCAGCTSSTPQTPSSTPETSQTTGASEVVGTWVEKITNDQYMVYNIMADGNAEMITYVISTGKTIISPTTWRDLGNHVYEIGNVRLARDINNQWQMSHQDSGVFLVSKYSSTITPHERIVDVVSAVARSSADPASEKLQRGISAAIGYLNMEPYSRIGLIKVLNDQNIDNALEAVDKANIDWMKQAELAAKKYVQRGADTESRLTLKLTELGFTDAEVQHGVAYAKENGLIQS